MGRYPFPTITGIPELCNDDRTCASLFISSPFVFEPLSRVHMHILHTSDRYSRKLSRHRKFQTVWTDPAGGTSVK